MTREETLLVKEIVEQSDRLIHFLIKKNDYLSLPKEVKEYFAFIDKAFNDLFIEMTVNKKLHKFKTNRSLFAIKWFMGHYKRKFL